MIIVTFALTRLQTSLQAVWADSFTVAFVIQGGEGDEKAEMSAQILPPPSSFNACHIGYEKGVRV